MKIPRWAESPSQRLARETTERDQFDREQADMRERRRLNPLCLADRAVDGDYLVMSLEVVPVNTDNHHLATFFNDMRASGWKLVAWNTPKVIFIKEHAK